MPRRPVQLQTEQVQIQSPEPQRRSDDMLRQLFFNYLPLALSLIAVVIGTYKSIDNPNKALDVRMTRLEDKVANNVTRLDSLVNSNQSDLAAIRTELAQQRELQLATQKDIVKLQTIIEAKNN
ncbi:MAG: hypothetical protein M3362_01300 [Acidobacteriota bacterium]|nr:hypothetical protein [Acidobacteriota bacterium]